MTMIGMQHNANISRETIKPFISTPSHLQTYNLSLIDQLAPDIYVPVLLLYPHNSSHGLSAHDKAQKLKKSLSMSLTRYYPFAGRHRSPSTPYVDCNDEGVEFVESVNNSQLLETLQRINEHDGTLDGLFADDQLLNHDSLVRVQLNHFACGGLGVAVSMSHNIGDGCTLGSFLNHWSSVARYGSADHNEVLPLNPHFIQSPKTDLFLPKAPVINQSSTRVTRKFVFTNSKLSDLKNKVIAGSTPPISNPTRVEVLTALLYKTAMAAATTRSGCFQPSYLIMPVNIRNKFVQKLPQTAFGNLLSAIVVPTRCETETSLNVTVAEIKKEKKQLDQGIQSVQHAAEHFISGMSKLGNEDLNDVGKRLYGCSSLCGFPYNKVDFGWGKPYRSILPLRSTGMTGFMLKDTPDGDGIEAFVILEKENMEIFQNDKEMLSFREFDRF